MNNLLSQYIKSLETGEKSPQTIRVYSKDLEKFFAYFPKVSSAKEIQALTVEDFRSFVATQSELKPSSLNGLLRSLSAFLSWCIASGLFESSEFFKMKFGRSRFIKVAKVRKIVLTDDEIEAIIKSGSNVQEKFMIALMVFTGIRRDEVCSIKLTDVNGCAILINGKGSKQRKIFLNETLCNFLNIYMAERNSESEYLFYGTRGEGGNSKLSGVAVNNRVKMAGKRAGIEEERLAKLSAHRLRGTALTNIIRQFGIQAAQKVAGHSNLATTSIYDESGDEVTMNALLNLKMGNGG